MVRTYLTVQRVPTGLHGCATTYPRLVAEVEIEEYDVVTSVMGVVSPCADRGGTIPRRRLSVSASSIRVSSAGTACHGVGDGKAFKRQGGCSKLGCKNGGDGYVLNLRRWMVEMVEMVDDRWLRQQHAT